MQVLLIDDHELVWNGTRRVLESVVAEFDPPESLAFDAVRDVKSAVARPSHQVDLVLLDYHLPDCGGLDALRAVRTAFEHAVVCMLSAENDARRVREVLEAGAAGFIPKSYPGPEMAAALRLLLLQRAFVPAEFLIAEDIVRGREVDEVDTEQLTAFLRHELSVRQRQVLRLALQGLPNKTIARRLDIAEGTVKVHLSMVYRALGVRNRVSALCRVLQADAAAALD